MVFNATLNYIWVISRRKKNESEYSKQKHRVLFIFLNHLNNMNVYNSLLTW